MLRGNGTQITKARSYMLLGIASAYAVNQASLKYFNSPIRPSEKADNASTYLSCPDKSSA